MGLPIPEGFHAVNVYIVVGDSVEALALYEKAFGAQTRMRMPGPDGEGTVHAEFRIGDSTVMMTDENEAWKARTPNSLGGSGASLYVYVDDVDAVFEQAREAGMEVMVPPMDQFYGDRTCRLKDPWGHEWSLGTHIEDVPPDEIEGRAQEHMKKMASAAPCPGDEETGEEAGGEAGGDAGAESVDGDDA